MAESDLLERLRTELPRLLREHPEVRHEIWGLMLEAFPSRLEFLELLQEVRASREAASRQFEELRSDLDRRFERVLTELHEHRLHLTALGGRVGRGMEHIVKEVVEELAGESFPSTERLRLLDPEGEVFGIPGARIELDSYTHDGTTFLVEVRSHLKSDDVLLFHRKADFAEKRLGRPVIKVIVALSMDPSAETWLQRLAIRYRVRATLD
jgi:hypothetical protein